MKVVRKILPVLLVGLLMFSVVACDMLYELYIKPNKKIINIELIYYDNPSARSNPLESYPLDLDKLGILEEINSSDIGSFLNKLSEIGEHAGGKYRQVLYSHDGVGIRITYEDTSFTLMTLTIVDGQDCMFVAEYDSDRKQVEYKSVIILSMIKDFNHLLSEYFSNARLIEN